MSNRHASVPSSSSQSISFNDIAQIVVQSRVTQAATEVPDNRNYGGLILQEWETVNAAVNAIKRRGGAPRGDVPDWNDMTIKIFVTLDGGPVPVEQWYFGWLGTPAINERQRATMYKALYTHLRVLPLYWLSNKKLPRLNFTYKIFAGPPNRPLSKDNTTEIFHVQRRGGQLRLSYDFMEDVGDLVHNNLSKRPNVGASVTTSTASAFSLSSTNTAQNPNPKMAVASRAVPSKDKPSRHSPLSTEQPSPRDRDHHRPRMTRDPPLIHNPGQSQQQLHQQPHRAKPTKPVPMPSARTPMSGEGFTREPPSSAPVDIPRSDSRPRSGSHGRRPVGAYSMQPDHHRHSSQASPLQRRRNQQGMEDPLSLPNRLRTEADYRFPFATSGSPRSVSSALSQRSPSDRPNSSSLSNRMGSQPSYGSHRSNLKISYLTAGGSPHSGPRSLTDSQYLSGSSQGGSIASDSEAEDELAMMEIPQHDTVEELPFAMDDGDELESFVQQFSHPLTLSMFSSHVDPRGSIARLDNNVDASRSELEQFDRSIARH